MEELFCKEFSSYREGKKWTVIPNEEDYKEMIEIIQRSTTTKEKLKQKEENIVRRYNLRVENGETLIYHNEKKVVKYEHIFQIL